MCAVNCYISVIQQASKVRVCMQEISCHYFLECFSLRFFLFSALSFLDIGFLLRTFSHTQLDHYVKVVEARNEAFGSPMHMHVLEISYFEVVRSSEVRVRGRLSSVSRFLFRTNSIILMQRFKTLT